MINNIQKNYKNYINSFPLAPDKLEIKRECQLKNLDLYNISIGNVKILVPKFFDKGKVCALL